MSVHLQELLQQQKMKVIKHDISFNLNWILGPEEIWLVYIRLSYISENYLLIITHMGKKRKSGY